MIPTFPLQFVNRFWFGLVFHLFVLKQDLRKLSQDGLELTMQPRLSLNSWSSHPSLLCDDTMGVNHQDWLHWATSFAGLFLIYIQLFGLLNLISFLWPNHFIHFFTYNLQLYLYYIESRYLGPPKTIRFQHFFMPSVQSSDLYSSFQEENIYWLLLSSSRDSPRIH